MLVCAKPAAEFDLLVAHLSEPRQQQRAIQRCRVLVRFDGQRRGEREGAVGADLDVRGALKFLIGRQLRGGRRGALEVEPLARRDDVRAGERYDELGNCGVDGRGLSARESRERSHRILDRARAVLGRHDLHQGSAAWRCRFYFD